MGKLQLARIVSKQIEVGIVQYSHRVSHFSSHFEIACISNDPSTQRQHPRGYLESLENHNALLEQHVAFLEGKLQNLQPAIDINRITSNTDDSESYNSGNDVSYQEPFLNIQ